MLNKYTRTAVLSSADMKAAYEAEYNTYSPEAASMLLLEQLMIPATVVIVLGTWCSDSRLYVPQFYKIADQLGIPENKITLIGVDESKSEADGLTDQLGIEKVPTFIFYEEEIERGRITECPVTTLEEDMIAILTKK